MSGEVHSTTNHAVIRSWAEARGGRPAEVASTGNREDPGILRIAFPGQGMHDDGNLQAASWDEFFRKFEDKKLKFVYQERLHDGEISRFCKFVYRESS